MAEDNDKNSQSRITRRGALKLGGAALTVTGLTSIAAASFDADDITGVPKGNRINNWISVEKVLGPNDVDVGFTEHHPKEPAACEYNGTYYLVAAVWDGYSANDKETVLLSSDYQTGGFTQISQVTNKDGVFMHAPFVMVDGSGELWVFISDKEGGGNDIRARHAPVDNIPSNPGGWTDEGIVISSARDPVIVRSGSTYYCFYTDEAGANGTISRQESTDLVNWSNEVENVYDSANNQGPHPIPKADGSGDWWMVNTAYDGEAFYAVAGEASSLTANEFTGTYEVMLRGSIAGIRRSWYSDWTSHLGYIQTNDSADLVEKNGDAVAYFEGGDGSQHYVGWARSDTDDSHTG